MKYGFRVSGPLAVGPDLTCQLGPFSRYKDALVPAAFPTTLSLSFSFLPLSHLSYNPLVP